ncbi:MAG: DUF1697 domain-containing protein [Betaproteobacteria bacterium]|nr:DUF1697 domain-containing protein [Betaproteobacteria bacterium]
MRFVVLLRGVNVGRGNRVPMADFRAMLETLGFSRVKTLLNSGNAVFESKGRSPPAAHATRIAAALSERMGVDVLVIVKSAPEWEALIAGNPLADRADDPSRLIAVIAPHASVLEALAPVGELVTKREAWHVGHDAAYLHCAEGILESKAGAALLGKHGRAATTRNWATVLKIAALLREPG